MDLIKYDVWRGFEAIEKVYGIVYGTILNKGYIAGSYAAYMAAADGMHVIQPNDVDIFATSERAFNEISDTLRFNSEYVLMEESAIAHTLQPWKNDSQLTLQIIKPHPDWKAWPDDMVNSFDLSVSKAVLVDKECILGDPEIGHKPARILRINDPLKSLKRVIKYAQRGVLFDDWELYKLFRAYEEMSEERKNKITEDVAATRIPDEDDYGWYEEDEYFDGE